MNREQAENILEAYINIECGGGDNKARQSLREVILDAMTEYRSKPTTWPGITIPTTSYPTNWDGSPKVTCSGIDPAFNTNTVSTVDGMAMAVGYQDGVMKVVDR